MFDVVSLIKAVGYFGVALVVFAESGLLIGIFLPGDSLLFTSGLLASQGFLSIVPLVVLTGLAAVIGDSTGYWFGRKFGRRLFSRPGSLFLNPAYITAAEHYYARYGAKTVFLSRFIPLIRTIAPALAGVAHMEYRTFIKYNILGAIIWGIGLPLAGYWLGSTVPNVDHYLLPIIGLIVVLSITPGLYHFWKEYRKK